MLTLAVYARLFPCGRDCFYAKLFNTSRIKPSKPTRHIHDGSDLALHHHHTTANVSA